MWNKIQRIYIGDHYQVYPKWAVNSNTVAYYPLDTDFNDYSWNWWNMTTKAGSPSITTLNGVKCCYFNGSSDIGNNDLHSSVIGTTFTICWWINITWTEVALFTDYYQPWNTWLNIFTSVTETILGLWKGNSQTQTSDNYSTLQNTWVFTCGTYSNQTVKIYKNWNITKTANNVSYSTDNNGYARIGWWNNRTSWTWERWFSNGYVSGLIIENRARTDQDVADYYNQTKATYLWFN